MPSRGPLAWQLRRGGAGPRRGLVMAMEPSRQDVVDLLRRLGLRELADEASRDLPDPVDWDRLEAWGMQHDISHDDLISWFGGSP
jgi:hypothetical protein